MGVDEDKSIKEHTLRIVPVPLTCLSTKNVKTKNTLSNNKIKYSQIYQ